MSDKSVVPATRDVIVFWDGQRFRFCPNCQSLAFKFAAEYAAQFVKALDRIANPIAHLQKEADEAGCKINGQMAVALAGDANWLREIAREALLAVKGESHDEI